VTEWWQYLVYALATIIVGAFLGGFFTYLFTRLGASQERESRERDQLRSAVRSILTEVETNLKLARQSLEYRTVPFANDIWTVHKGEILSLPRELQNTLHELYVAVQIANTLVEVGIHQGKIGGMVPNQPYEHKRSEIKVKAEKARASLVNWLKQEGIEVILNGDQT